MTDRSPLVVRAARPADRDGVWLLVRDFATSYQPERAAFAAAFDGALASADTLVLVAGTPLLDVAGYLLAHRHATFFANGPVTWVEEVMVEQNARRQGVGRALMHRAEEWGRSGRAVYLSLASRRAGDFYLALGYEDSAVFFKKALT